MPNPAITRHWTALKKRGLDLGAAQGEEQDAGYGGRIQVYERGRIYWHASTGAHELHGRLLERYLQAGGHDVNPGTGERELGFPTSDHIATEDGRFECATFEWGIIADVSGTPLVRLFGRLHEAWRAAGGALGRFGHPLDDVTRIEGGRAAWFERGFLWHAEGSPDMLAGELLPPTPGQPLLVDPASSGPFEWLRLDGAVGALDTHPGLGVALVRGRLSLVPVGGGDARDLVPAGATTAHDGARWLPLSVAGGRSGPGGGRPVEAVMARRLAVHGDRLGDSVMGQPTAGLTRRQLYSLAFRTPGMAPRVISPHCLYARNDWENFGLAHITDLHVSRRIDYYRAQLRATGVPEADVARLNNWNDAFRNFIRYANHLHDAGLLDVIIATGDLVDYVREANDHPEGPGNYGFLEALLQGKAPGRDPESALSEPLRVPIFTSLGNHDYRQLPYALGLDLRVTTGDATGAIPLVGDMLGSLIGAGSSLLDRVPGLGVLTDFDPVDLVVSNLTDTMWNHAGLNTTHDEALRLMGFTVNGSTYLTPVLRPKAAGKAVQVETGMRNGTHYYFRRINPARSYVVRLGMHRVVMLDTRWDEGIVDEVSEAVLEKLGFGSESQKNFVGGQPDSVGVTSSELDLLRGALTEAGANGIVIVGMHAPPLNPAGTDLSNCLRESAHPTAAPEQVTGWLMRKKPGEFIIPNLSGSASPAPNHATKRKGWPRTGTPHFHEGPVEDLLDEGIAVGQQEALAQLLAGVGAPRPATLLCSGHGHTRIEYRLRWDATRDLLLAFTDHYLGNPETYYRSWLVGQEWWKPDTHKRYLTRIKAGSPAAGDAVTITDHQETIWPDLSELRVPPYATPLADAADPAAWWRSHAPVVVQTAAVGPCTNTRATLKVNKHKPGPNFQGFRLMQIADNVIARVHYVGMPEVQGAAFPLPWESDGSVVAPPPVGPQPGTPPVQPPSGPGVVRPDGAVVRDHRRHGGGTVRDHRRE